MIIKKEKQKSPEQIKRNKCPNCPYKANDSALESKAIRPNLKTRVSCALILIRKN